MNDKKIKEQLQQENIIVPESLQPEQMRKKLEQHKEANTTSSSLHPTHAVNWKKRMGQLAATVVIFLGCIQGFKLIQQQGATLLKAPNNSLHKMDTSTQKQSYEKAYKKLNSYNIENKQDQNADQAKDDTSSQKQTSSSTNVRTDGVDEGDFVKTDGNYIYAFRNSYDTNTVSKVEIFQADNTNPKKVSSISLADFKGFSITDMYIKDDKLILIGQQSDLSKKDIARIYESDGGNFENYHANSWSDYYGCPDEDVAVAKKSAINTNTIYTRTIIYNVSNKEHPILETSTFQDGTLEATRMVEDVLYVISNRSFSPDKIDKKEPATYIPQICGQVLSEKDVYVEEEETGCNYTVLSSYDVTQKKYIDQKADYGNSNMLYMGKENLYIASMQNEYLIKDSTSKDAMQQEHIVKYSYTNGFMNRMASGTVNGYIFNDYCIDEQNGYLRVVTTYYNKDGIPKNGLFVLDSNLKQVGSLKDLAKNETLYSARFTDNMAYFVTYQNTDPLFTVDLSDPENPVVMDELKLPGHSDYLHPVTDTLLLGIGEETTSTGTTVGLKLSLYDISNQKKVKEISKKVLKNYDEAEVLYDPNALYINTEKKEFGFCVEAYGKGIKDYGGYDYLLYNYDETKGLTLKAKNVLIKDNTGYQELQARGFRIENDFYIVSVAEKIKAMCVKEQ